MLNQRAINLNGVDQLSEKSSVGVLFVCLGNICRSPSSEGVFRQCVKQENLDFEIHIDSAGTGNYHIGLPPDSRAINAAARRGINLKNLRARQIRSSDFMRYDYIVAMDHQNYSDLVALAPSNHDSRICLFMDFAQNAHFREIPDPYYGGDAGFEQVLDLITKACIGLIDDIKKHHLSN